jgi:hypothetical protein
LIPETVSTVPVGGVVGCVIEPFEDSTAELGEEL